ncbi:MAG: ATP-binding cassette domain-containing protein [Deltaproteobacteria bacterium]|nr:ATP-binding cassette domain-containing protein [Deltaproteobacteria bacterium]MBW1816253.1 ATP-binding cassette domain-containing protein [Deltaproteobacteria bacterium]
MLNVNGIDVGYGHAMVLHDVSLELKKGEMVFIVGRNGAGKTTLLKTISGIMQPANGGITYDGEDTRGLSAEKLARRGMRFVAQDKKVFTHLTVRDNLQLAAHASKEKMSDAIQKATSIYPDLSKFMESKAGGLSGGQREILLIGRALVGSPRLLLIDEPTEGLAAIVIEDISRILNQLKSENVSAIIVEQNLSLVNRLADRIYVMKEGKIIKEIADKSEMRDTAGLENYL